MQFVQRPLAFSRLPAQGQVIALRPLPHPQAARVHAVGPIRAKAPRPLRLIVNRGADGSCRLMASGRLADVCAELNRLALA
ncbi:MAG: hypothetical protein WBG44_09905 [Comamonas sp.]|jgi:hypothetical protein|nr:hypothetical protein [Comamonas sp.]